MYGMMDAEVIYYFRFFHNYVNSFSRGYKSLLKDFHKKFFGDKQ